MNTLDRISIVTLIVAMGFIVYGFVQVLTRPAPAFGAAQEVVYNELPVSSVWVGSSLDILTLATNTARTSLRIQNVGATTSTTVYCNTNDRVSALHTGIVLGPTTTIEFDLDNMYRGALRCRAANASTTLFIQER
jgi:EamA domain-containing membrane protein RarD